MRCRNSETVRLGGRTLQSLRLEAVGGYESLAEADTAVAGRNFRVEVDFEGFGAQAVQHQLKQQDIMKAPAAEADAIQFALFADLFGEFHEHDGKTGMKSSTDVGDGFLATQITKQPLKERKCADLPMRVFGDQVEGIAALVSGIVRSHFEFDGGLRFVIYSGANAGERSHGVEKTAATGSARRMDLPIDHLLDDFAAAFVDTAKKG